MGSTAAGQTADRANAPRIYSFAPISALDARCLILGSMPGVASLRAQQYYAHPHNAFWRIMGDLYDAGADLPYEVRLRKLRSMGVAVWDVLQACERPGSLDADIVPESVQVQDFAGFFAAHPQLGTVCFNGAKAAETYRRHVPKAVGAGLRYLRLPSTSPAHAGMPYAAKLAAWREALPQPG